MTSRATTPAQIPNTDHPGHTAPEPLHQPSSWLADNLRLDPDAQFTELTMDICYGLQTCLELIHGASASPSPVLGHSDADRLLRLAIATTGLLAGAAQDHIDWINERSNKEPS